MIQCMWHTDIEKGTLDKLTFQKNKIRNKKFTYTRLKYRLLDFDVESVSGAADDDDDDHGVMAVFLITNFFW